MRITKVRITNFRLLHEVNLQLEETVTVIVGRNNCGKTSLSDVIRKFLDEKGSFKIEDFSSASYDDFCSALRAFIKDAPAEEVRGLVPYIELRIHVAYEKEMRDFGALRGFVIDTNDESTEAVVVCRRELTKGAIDKLFDGYKNTTLVGEKELLPDDVKISFFKSLSERVPKLFETVMWAEDPNDSNNISLVQPTAVKGLISIGFINAQRGLDGSSSRETDVLGKVLESLFLSASLPTAEDDQKSIAVELQTAIKTIQTSLDVDFKTHLSKLMPTIKSFGYPGLDGPEIETETKLEVTRLLTDFTKIRYAGYSGVPLPEAYNGLGFRNLLFILLQIVGFYREFQAEPKSPGLHLIVIEEPEAHLHPQMQEVFIRHLSSIVEKLTEGSAKWPVQFIVSTHSPHVANEARFEAIRYFAVTSKDRPIGVRCTQVKDLRSGFSNMHPTKTDFLHQYLTLTRCDLFFADKAILVEGTSERLMLPKFIRAMDMVREDLNLSSQYITIMEVGGAYAHIFFQLLEFLGIRTLIITDLDSVYKNENGRWAASLVHNGKRTSNACIKHWFASKKDNDKAVEAAKELQDAPDEEEDNDTNALSIDTLLAAKDDKINGNLRIAYQIPEAPGKACGRTFEDAFILANPTIFGLDESKMEDQAAKAKEIADDYKKSKFALKFAILETNWTTPKYISEGLIWLSEHSVSVVDPNLKIVAVGDVDTMQIVPKKPA